jgi:lipoprotein NlpI
MKRLATLRRLTVSSLVCICLAVPAGARAEQACAPGHAKEVIAACTNEISNHPKTEKLQADLETRSFGYGALGDWTNAIADLRAAIAITPKDNHAWLMLGVYHTILKQPGEAEDDFLRAQELDPDYYILWTLRCFVDDFDRRFDKCIEDSSRAIKLQPGKVLAYRIRATDETRLGRYAEAMADDDAILRIDPTSSFGLMNRSYNEVHRYQAQAALKDANRLLALHADLRGVHLNRARAEIEEGNFDAGLADYLYEKEHYPDSGQGWNGIAYAEHLVGHDDLALADYNKVLEMKFPGISPLDDPLIGPLGTNGPVAFSLEVLKPKLWQPEHATAHDGLSMLALGKGDLSKALQEANLAVADDPDASGPYRTRGNVEFAQAEWSLAQKDFAQAVANFPEAPYAALWQYLSTERSGSDGTQALRQTISSSTSADWPMPIAHFFLGDIDEQALLKAVDSVPDASVFRKKELQCEAYFYLGEAALLRGDKATATRWFQATIGSGITSFIEYGAAGRELKSLP